MKSNTLSWMAESKGSKAKNYAYNHHTGHSNDGRGVQMTQMPNRRGMTAGDSTGQNTAAAKELGHRSWEPSAHQNYKGNADHIQMRQMPNRKGNQC